MDEIREESWSHLHELLFAGSWHERLQRHRSDFAYRGEASTAAKLVIQPATARRRLRRAPRSAVPEDSLWHRLALGKHHGLATRLLD